jgi:hypothetical protein
MENLHNWINSAVLVVLGIAYFTQNTILQYMKSAMDAINIEKIKQAQEFIETGREQQFNIQLGVKIKEINHEANIRYQEVNKDVLDQYNELINIPFQIMRDKDWQFRERHLLHYPKNAEMLRALLEAYDKGELPPLDKKGN